MSESLAFGRHHPGFLKLRPLNAELEFWVNRLCLGGVLGSRQQGF